MANKPQALIKLSGPNRKVSFISEDGETINAIKEGINTYKLSGSDAPAPIIESVYTYKGSKATYDELPTENNKVGDVWNVVAAHDTTPAGTNYAWTGTEWDALGGTYTDTNTWRPIQVEGTDKLTDASTSINFAGSGGTSVSYANGTITVSSPAIGTESTQVAAGNHTHSGYAATSHNHTKSQITDFPTLATVATSGSYNDLKNKPNIPAAYTLPAATNSVLGGVKIDNSTIKINSNGQLYANVEGGGGGGSSTGDWGTKVVTYDGKTSIQAVTNFGFVGFTRGNGAVDLQQDRSSDTRIASGDYSVAMGVSNTASGVYSVAMGESSTASDCCSVAMGQNNIASAYSSVAIGRYNIASGNSSVAIGLNNTASGDYSVATGNSNNCAISGAVTNNNVLDESVLRYNRFGHTGFKGFNDYSGNSIKLFKLSNTDVLIARIDVINSEAIWSYFVVISGSSIQSCTITVDAYNNANINNLYMSNGVLNLWARGLPTQVGMFYTLYSNITGGSSSSSSGSSSSY